MKIGLTTHGPGVDGKALKPGQAALILEGKERDILAVLDAAIKIRDTDPYAELFKAMIK
ncbi:hypothetical protein SEA_GAIL_51 [Mycobacterium phage Gail]|uniref:Uncharacterized protein n=1 Tax=Mycobacterium phage Gail TaxID=2743994 RepID=A0A7D5KCJ1_9CAUD|nr:hypothetical protein KNV16_gp058 [Mycobacterium phage Gail]QLF84615.1 hypothetical protein SEA_GAIL_51 [Mycobacterium phage Gail]